MNRGDLRALVREHVNEPTAGFWSDAQLNIYLNLAKDQVTAFMVRLDEDFFELSATFSTAVGTKSYLLPADAMQVNRIERYTTADAYDITMLEPVGHHLLGRNGYPFGSNNKPDYYDVRGVQFDLYPTPDAIYPMRLYYDQRQADMSQDSDVPGHPREAHPLIAARAAKMALTKQGDTGEAVKELIGDLEDTLSGWLTGRRGSVATTVAGYME